jgi:hypothetical protein
MILGILGLATIILAVVLAKPMYVYFNPPKKGPTMGPTAGEVYGPAFWLVFVIGMLLMLAGIGSAA